MIAGSLSGFKDRHTTQVKRLRVAKYIFVHGSDDPYCSIDDAKDLCNPSRGNIYNNTKRGHLSNIWNTTEVPQIIDQLKVDSVL